jgi:putative transposase
MREEQREAIALFRYGIILPFLSQEKLEWGMKGEIRRRLASQGYDIPHSSKHTIDEETIRKWVAAYKEKGFDALKPKTRADAGKMRTITAEAWEMAVALKKEAPGRSVEKIIRIMETNGLIAPGQLKRSTLSFYFKVHGYDRKSLMQDSQIHRRFQAKRPNQIWQSDILYGPYLPDPRQPEKKKRTYLVAFIDDFSRLLPHGEFYWDEKYPTLENTLKKAILKRGLPEIIYVDNGAVYSTRKLDAICASLGIRKISCKPYSPEGKGKIERFFRTLREDFLREPELQKIETLPELNRLFWAWLEVDYHQRSHSATQHPPLEQWRENIGQYLRMVDEKQLREVFLFQVSRKVNKVGVISLEGVEFEVEPLLKNKKVEVRYNPFNLSQVNIYHQGNFIQQAKPLIITASNKARKQTATIPRPPGPPPKSGVNPLAKLADQFVQQQKHTATKLTGHKPSPKPFTLAQFIRIMASSLNRKPEQFHAREIETMKIFLQKYPQLVAPDIGLALARTILIHGYDQHIHSYLEAIAQQHLKNAILKKENKP